MQGLKFLFHQIHQRLNITQKSLCAFLDFAHALQNFPEALQKFLNALQIFMHRAPLFCTGYLPRAQSAFILSLWFEEIRFVRLCFCTTFAKISQASLHEVPYTFRHPRFAASTGAGIDNVRT